MIAAPLTIYQEHMSDGILHICTHFSFVSAIFFSKNHLLENILKHPTQERSSETLQMCVSTLGHN